MIDSSLVSDTTPAGSIDQTAEQILATMREYSVSQLPLLEGRKYVGVAIMEELGQLKELNKPITESGALLRKAFVHNTSHIFDVLRVALDFNVRIVPVVDAEGDYLGLVSAESCMRAFALLNSVKDAGAVIELEIPLKDFLLSEVSRIVEDNECRVLVMYTNINQHDMTVQVTMKLNTTEIAAIVASFERYEYVVKGVYNDTEYSEGLKDRYDALMRYLNV